jgi:hypothetical protein
MGADYHGEPTPIAMRLDGDVCSRRVAFSSMSQFGRGNGAGLRDWWRDKRNDEIEERIDGVCRNDAHDMRLTE